MLGLSTDHRSLTTTCSPPSPKAACLHHCFNTGVSPLCHMASTCELHFFHCIGGCPAHHLLCCFSSLSPNQCHLRGETDEEDWPCAVVCCIAHVQLFFYQRSFCVSQRFFWLCHAQLISRHSSVSQAPHRYDSLALLCSVSYMRSTLPAVAILPCACAELPSGTAVILNL